MATKSFHEKNPLVSAIFQTGFMGLTFVSHMTKEAHQKDLFCHVITLKCKLKYYVYLILINHFKLLYFQDMFTNRAACSE